MIQQSIDGKYDIIKTLHETAATAVLLVRHRQIGDVRILKAIQKSHPDANRILSEANLLSGLRSPGIPTIYDVGQTDVIFYLVEEYVEGQPLQEYLPDRGAITLQELLVIIIEVCKIIKSLHESVGEPLIYRDLKPEHIIINEGLIRLIDFGAVVKKSETKKALPYCSKAFAAPEQLQQMEIDERADVYAIGKVIEYSLVYLEPKAGYRIQNIVRHATEPEVEKRISSVNELLEQLEVLQGKKSNEKPVLKHLNTTIGIVGSGRAVGCTHIAVNLCSFMNKIKGKYIYSTQAEDKPVINLSRNLEQSIIRDGVLYHDSFCGLMEYGEGVEEITPPNGNYIYDYGYTENKPYTDYVIYVVSLCPWKKPLEIPEWIREDNVYIITNFTSRIASLKLSKMINKAVYVYPNTSKTFKISKQEKQLFNAIRKRMKI